jgi:hypothetical protein
VNLPGLHRGCPDRLVARARFPPGAGQAPETGQDRQARQRASPAATAGRRPARGLRGRNRRRNAGSSCASASRRHGPAPLPGLGDRAAPAHAPSRAAAGHGRGTAVPVRGLASGRHGPPRGPSGAARAAASPPWPAARPGALARAWPVPGYGERGGLRPGGIASEDPAVAKDKVSRSRRTWERCGRRGCGGGAGGGHFSVSFHAGFARVLDGAPAAGSGRGPPVRCADGRTAPGPKPVGRW